MTDQAFHDRLNRINSGTQWAPDGVIMPSKKARKKRSQRAEIASNARYPISIGLAFVLGMLTVLVARWARFHLFPFEAGGDVLMDSVMIDAAMSSGLAFVIRMATNLKSPVHLTAKSFGITACVMAMHLAVHQFPGPFALLFSPEWVELVIDQTDPHGILFFSFEE